MIRARLFIPNENERFLRDKYNVISYSMLLKTVSTIIFLQPKIRYRSGPQKGRHQPKNYVDLEGVE